MKPTLKLLVLSTSLAAALGMSACGRNDSQTVGQSVDKAIAETKAQTETAKAATKDAAAQVVASASDATITAKVNAALVTDDRLKVMKIDVDTKDGKVTLSGTAPDAESRDRATTMVKAIEGVSEVNNGLTVNAKP